MLLHLEETARDNHTNDAGIGFAGYPSLYRSTCDNAPLNQLGFFGLVVKGSWGIWPLWVVGSASRSNVFFDSRTCSRGHASGDSSCRDRRSWLCLFFRVRYLRRGVE